MLKIENTEAYGWEAAIRGMRNPMNSWEKSDSNLSCECCEGCYYEPQNNTIRLAIETDECEAHWCNHTGLRLGENDLKLMKTLSKAGSDHGKFLRMITVTMDITAPLYWWKEFDTYKVGTVANSCSTMHKIHAKEFTMNDFSCEYLEDPFLGGFRETIGLLNIARNGFLCARKEENPLISARDYWWQMIQLLPSSYNQRRTVQLNYQVLKAMYHARKNHKLDEWRTFCEWVETLPYAKELIAGEE